MKHSAKVRMYTNTEAAVAQAEHDALDADRTHATQVALSHCIAILSDLAKQRANKGRLDRECDPRGNNLYCIRCSHILMLFGVKFDRASEMTQVEIVHFLRCDGLHPHQSSIKLAMSRNKQFQEALTK